MKILSVSELEIPDVKVVEYARFVDNRGYFTETYRKLEFDTNPKTTFLKGLNFTQANESYSKRGVVRGLHFQWNPYMAKLVRILSGRVIDLALDIRVGSPSFGKIVGHKLIATPQTMDVEWIYVPAGFAHGLVFIEESTIEYFCTGYWSPETEAGINPLATDIDWSLCKPNLTAACDDILKNNPVISDKDRGGYTLEAWQKKQEAKNFTYGY